MLQTIDTTTSITLLHMMHSRISDLNTNIPIATDTWPKSHKIYISYHEGALYKVFHQTDILVNFFPDFYYQEVKWRII